MEQRGKRSARTFTGNPPKEGILLVQVENWALYVRTVQGQYINMKLCATHPTPNKANWWLTVDRKTRELIRLKDCVTLKTNHPKIAEWVTREALAFLEKHLGSGKKE